MNKLAKFGLVGLLSLGIAGCASMPSQPVIEYKAPIIRIETKRVEGETISTAEGDEAILTRNYRIEDLQHEETKLSFVVRKSEKEEIITTISSYTPLYEKRYKNTYSGSYPYSLEESVLLEERKLEGISNVKERKEEHKICENENAEGIKVCLAFRLPYGDLLVNAITDSEGRVSLDMRSLEKEVHKTRNKNMFFSAGNARAYFHDKLTKELNVEGQKLFTVKEINDMLVVGDLSRNLTIMTSEDDREGIINKNDKISINISLKELKYDNLYKYFKGKVKTKIEDWLQLSHIEWNVIDAETRKPVNFIEARFIPVKTKTYEDIKKQEYLFRSKYFVKDSDLFNKTEINPAKEFDILYDSKLPFINGNLMFNVPVPSVYKVEFTDAKDNATYRGFLTEVKFTGSERSTVELERIGTRIEIDTEKSRGKINRMK